MLSNRLFSVGRSGLLLASVLGLVACGGGNQAGGDTAGGSDLTGSVLVDGSSTVFPISEAMAEEFGRANPGVAVTVGVSGTGGGFRKFCAGETDISGASRPIRQEEIDLCAQAGIEFVELPIAFDGLSVVVNPSNEFAQCLTTDELKTMWEPAAQGTITNWNQIRADFPDQPLGLYGAGTDSGTYDFFMEAIGADGESRGDFTASEDDNVIVQGVSTDNGGLGFFGFAYYVENADRLQLVAVDGGTGCVAPSPETIADGSYQPLSRPEFIYVKTTSLENPAVKAFVEFYLDMANAPLIDEVGYVSLPADMNAKVLERLATTKTGSVFEGGSAVGKSLEDLL
ncbi:phosphate-binding protein [Leptolyngbya sp. BL0902]|uniref:PstS family phosphate ABC transporter substrate-binding protein n=1 Tax=Leptolyngbya sp. BL0902 TaxID=1115757 RepID=UPI0018E70BC4|nr:PstS family phosphate ABC transporter substrate-binding protein [Leptolyngbya sp. BL0902]QQE64760.1 phosphate-binding protein [Leptolyngbya sp. BL0902]